jgi:hypothetical protein
MAAPKPDRHVDLWPLAVALAVLKITETVDWSWWTVTAPLWGPYALVAVVIAAALGLIVLGLIAGAFGWLLTKARGR